MKDFDLEEIYDATLNLLEIHISQGNINKQN